MLPLFSSLAGIERACLRDLLSIGGDPAPDGLKLDAWETLLAEAKAAGVRVLDLRGYDRTLHYGPRSHCIQDGHDFGAWGWFKDQKDDKDRDNDPDRGRARGALPWEKRTGIILHTCAVVMSAPRFLGTPCHVGIADDGTIVLCHPGNAYVWHAQAGNRWASGIEISGKRGAIKPIQITATRIAIRFLHAERQEQHAGPMVIGAHRQTHEGKPNDPGPAIWSSCGEWAIAEMGLGLGPVVGTGREIPENWRTYDYTEAA